MGKKGTGELAGVSIVQPVAELDKISPKFLRTNLS